MHHVDAQAVYREFIGIRNDARAQFVLVERAKPRVVVAGHDRELAATALEFGQPPQAIASQEVARARARGHPEIAEIAGDQEGVIGGQAGSTSC